MAWFLGYALAVSIALNAAMWVEMRHLRSHAQFGNPFHYARKVLAQVFDDTA